MPTDSRRVYLRFMKRLPLSILAITLVAGVLPLAAEIDLVRVWPGYREAKSFNSVSEFFGGNSAKSNQLAQRTQHTERAGYYWLVRTKADTAYSSAKARLEVARTDSTEPVAYEFEWETPKGGHAVSLGVTGTDWPDPTEVPIAWRLTLLSPDGIQRATTTSYLWQDP